MEALKPEDPQRIGPFTPVARIGAGGMGRVYLARSRGGRPVALKVIRAEYAEDERFRTRFRREVEAARTVDGLYTASVLDAGLDDDDPWLATAYIPGPSLQQVVYQHGPLPEHSARVLGAGIAEALGAIHAAGLIHRDLKPSNVICGPDGPRVIDFGISHAVDGTSLTATGIVVGSPRYASPEQCRLDAEVLPASDVFALGGVLVFATTGVPPFGDGPDHVQLYLVVHEKPDLTGVPLSMRSIVGACLEKDPANRPTIDQLLDELLPTDYGHQTDWLPEAVNRSLREYSVSSVTGSTEIPTHARPEQDPVRTPTPHQAANGLDTPPGGASPSAELLESAGMSPANPSRRRILTGVIGLAAVAASGGGAWYAATRSGKKSNAGAGTGATPSNSAATSSQPPATTSASQNPATPPTSQPTGVQFGASWVSPANLTFGTGAIVTANKIVGIFQSTGSDPNPPQSLMVLNTANGHNVFDPTPIPAISLNKGLNFAADDKYAYTYSAGTVYAWSLQDGSKSVVKAKVLPATDKNGNTTPDIGILGLIDGVLILGPASLDISFPTCLVGLDVTAKDILWTKKPTDLLGFLPATMTPPDATIALTIPPVGTQAFITLSDSISVRVLKSFDPKTGHDGWKFDKFAGRSENNAGTNYPTVSASATRVYLTDMHSGSIHAYTADGKWMWTHPDPDAPNHVTVTQDQRFTGPVAEADGVTYATNARNVIALDINGTSNGTSIHDAGKVLWTSKPFTALRTPPIVANGEVWVEVETPGANTGDLTLTSLKLADGGVDQQIPMPPGSTGGSSEYLAADDQGLYVVAAAGEVLGYRKSQ